MSIEFRGVESVSESDLRSGLALREDPGWRAELSQIPFIGAPPAFYNPFHWRRDRERIIAFYHQQGFFDATIVSESIIEDPETRTVRIRVTIEEGPPTRINRLEIQGLIDGETPSQRELLQGLPLNEGDIFTEQNYQTTRGALSDRLRQAGHAYATVSGRVFVDPVEQSADVYFFADPGPRARLGPVYILGLESVREEQVRAALPFRRGDPFSPGALTRAQGALYDLGVFGVVTILPAHEARDFNLEQEEDRERLDQIFEEFEVPDHPSPEADPGAGIFIPPEADGDTALGISRILAGAQRRAESRSRLDTELPIVVRVQEAKRYNLRLGAGLAAEGTRQDVRAIANWSARNFLGGLRRLDLYNAVGYAWAPNILTTPEDGGNRGVILQSELTFQQPQFFEPRTSLRLRAALERDVREGFSVWNPSARIGVDRPFRHNFYVSLSYNLAYFYYPFIAPGLDALETALGVDFREEFLLEYLEQSVAYDVRDDVLDPTSGYMVALTVQQASRYLFGGEFDFVRPILSAETYFPYQFFSNWVLALRGRMGSAYTFGRDNPVPVQHRLYSGGADSMRSFGRRRLSLYTQEGEAVPVGGLTQFEASVEPRVRLRTQLAGIGDVWGALFLDAATVLNSPFLTGTDPQGRPSASVDDLFTTLVYGAGAGVWWNTPVGPVRLDFAYTLSNLEDDVRFRRCVNPDNYPTQACEFEFEDPGDDPIQNRILGWGIYLSIGHSF